MRTIAERTTMTTRQDNLTVTLHWLHAGQEQTTTVVCEDSPPAQLLPLLLAGCNLAANQPYQLREGAADGRALREAIALSAQGIRSGCHLWLSDKVVERRVRCLISLPDGGDILAPTRGIALTRSWLLQLLALSNPTAHAREITLLEQRNSAFAYVSKRPHCTIRPNMDGAWIVASERNDIATLLNGVRLAPGVPAPIADGDRLTLGDGGLGLRLGLV
ncbi:MAG: FHA domain-containing protein [Candidatus Viridilinea halotolerans]|uniref:FHA domain-containing protein n=1 Tax=Candidatus Viridilinea halotolerans TaxID=2491704 RepID=A0A426TWP3_9CHLR|nr:MAG: FHA domain-containing protein [Candidatus Viridilinea halotolerans]